MTVPTRLLELGATEEERWLLEAGASEVPSPALTNSMRQAIGLPLPVGVPPAPGPVAPPVPTPFVPASTLWPVLPLAVGGVIVGLLAATWVAMRPVDTEAPRQDLNASAPRAPDSARSSSTPVVASVAASAPRSLAPPPARPVLPPRSITEEVRLLDQARAAVRRGDSKAGLAALDTYRRRYPTGAFRQEADVLRIEAVQLQGDRAHAAELAREFVKQNPASPHASRAGRVAEIPPSPSR